jgi:hypothetical protein
MSDDIEQGTLEQEVLPPGYPTWRRAHLFASWTVAVVGLAHCVVTALVFRAWDESAVWFLGTGIGVLFVGTLNLAHIGLGPCRMPTTQFVRIANWTFVAFGAAAVVAVPQPQAVVLVATLAVQAVASRVTLPGPG